MASNGTNREDVDEGMTSRGTNREDGRQEPREMQNLLGGRENQLKRLEACDNMIAKLEENLQLYLKYVYGLLNLYFVLLGAVLTAVSQVSSSPSSPSAKCHQRFYFISFSVMPFLLNGIPLFLVVCKFVEANNEVDKCVIKRESIRCDNGGGQPLQLREDGYRKVKYKFCLIMAALILVFFNGLVIFACNSLLCGDNQTRANVNDQCFRACSKNCTY